MRVKLITNGPGTARTLSITQRFPKAEPVSVAVVKATRRVVRVIPVVEVRLSVAVAEVIPTVILIQAALSSLYNKLI